MSDEVDLIARAKVAAAILIEYENWEPPSPPPDEPIDYAWTAQVIRDLVEALEQATSSPASLRG